MNPTTDTPLNACPHCGAGAIKSLTGYPNITGILKQRECGSVIDPFYPEKETRTELCREREARQKAEAENVCLQELIQEFYEWSRRDFPTEQEVREIMNRYYDLLNK